VTRLKKQRDTRISTILRFTVQREDPGLSAWLDQQKEAHEVEEHAQS
jgi:hypothetical protein